MQSYKHHYNQDIKNVQYLRKVPHVPLRSFPPSVPGNHWRAFCHYWSVSFLLEFYIRSHSTYSFASGFPCSAQCFVPLYIMCIFSSVHRKIFNLSLLFRSLIIMCIGIVLFVLILLGGFQLFESVNLSFCQVWVFAGHHVFKYFSIFLHELKFYMLKQILCLWVSVYFLFLFSLHFQIKYSFLLYHQIYWHFSLPSRFCSSRRHFFLSDIVFPTSKTSIFNIFHFSTEMFYCFIYYYYLLQAYFLISLSIYNICFKIFVW